METISHHQHAKTIPVSDSKPKQPETETATAQQVRETVSISDEGFR
jgi:hypothetical protein